MSPIKITLAGVWLVALSGLGCAAAVTSAPPTPEPQPIVVERRTVFVPRVSTTRPAAVAAAIPTVRPVIAKPRLQAAPTPAVAIKPVPIPETWDGKGKCEGVASFYAGKFLGRRTANGEVYTGRKLTAAHRVLPFGSYVRVTNLQNGLDVIVRINDRGPYVAGRVIDLSPAAAKKLHMTKQGVVPVKLEVVAAWIAEGER